MTRPETLSVAVRPATPPDLTDLLDLLDQLRHEGAPGIPWSRPGAERWGDGRASAAR